MAFAPKQFQITLKLRDGKPVGHSVRMGEEDPTPDAVEASGEQGDESPPIVREEDFLSVFNSFLTSMDLYMRFVPMTMEFAPMISSAVAGEKIAEFAAAKGVVVDDLSNGEQIVYELNISHLREFMLHHGEIVAAMETTAHLPRVMIIGLISAYDYFLSSLLKIVLTKHEEIVLTSEKTIKLSDLLEFGSIDDAKSSILAKEIEGVIRESHFEQFKWMERTFSMKLREGLTVFPSFIEVCERRNLFTHTGGVVSAQYMANCKQHGVSTKGVYVGLKLDAGPKYFMKAVETVYEVGAKLNYVLWRKFDPASTKQIDTFLNERCFDLIYKNHYRLAEAILSFAVDVLKERGGSDYTHKMMLVNLANAIRLQGREDVARQIMDKEDWSATDDHFRLCVAAVKQDIDGVVALMKALGPQNKMDMETYRTWPVFRKLRTNEKISEAFFEIFGEPLLKAEDLKQEAKSDIGIRLKRDGGNQSVH